MRAKSHAHHMMVWIMAAEVREEQEVISECESEDSAGDNDQQQSALENYMYIETALVMLYNS